MDKDLQVCCNETLRGRSRRETTRGVPVLQYSQARSGRRDLGKSYSNEERE